MEQNGIEFFSLLEPTKLFLWLFKIPDFSRIIWTFHMKTNTDFPYENKTFPPSSFLYGEAI